MPYKEYTANDYVERCFPLMWIYQGERLVGCTTMTCTRHGHDEVQWSAPTDQLPPGKYEYEITGAGIQPPGKRFALEIKDA